MACAAALAGCRSCFPRGCQTTTVLRRFFGELQVFGGASSAALMSIIATSNQEQEQKSPIKRGASDNFASNYVLDAKPTQLEGEEGLRPDSDPRLLKTIVCNRKR